MTGDEKATHSPRLRIPGRRNPSARRTPRRVRWAEAAALACLAVALPVSSFVLQHNALHLLADQIRASQTLPSPRNQDSAVRSRPANGKPSRPVIPSAARPGHTVTASVSGAAVAPGPSNNRSPGSSSPSPASPSSSLPSPVGWWKLNDGSGTTAADAMNRNPAIATDAGWCDNCATFNGSSSYFKTAGQVLETGPGASFTVAASVYLTRIPANGAFATAVSQGGVYDSTFFLQYSGPDKRWAFTRAATDSNTSTDPFYRALSTSAPTLDQWTYLVGVFNGATDQMTLYVNGVAQGTATDPTPFVTPSTGRFVIGRALYKLKNSDFFPGDLRNVEAFQQALSSTQVQQLYSERSG